MEKNALRIWGKWVKRGFAMKNDERDYNFILLFSLSIHLAAIKVWLPDYSMCHRKYFSRVGGGHLEYLHVCFGTILLHSPACIAES